ncbi:MAG: alanyl-tRNA editing protein [Spirochaetales bacterium]|nr:alanyl-tRNA editing protein [Spirochaetales bacterium]
MKTEPLYYNDNALLSFKANIINIEQVSDKKYPGKIRVQLDKTAFYPEGGGQPADLGTLGNFSVVHVKKDEGEIWHYLTGENLTIESLTPGDEVEGKVDADHRLDYQQQHTGQHILSAVFMALGEYATVSVHQGEDYTTIEFATPGIDDEFLFRAEERANEIVCENKEIKTHWTDEEGLEEFKLRRPAKQKENIRIVEIDGIDTVACGGIHLSTTGQTGFIKLTATAKIRGNMRTFWKIGKRTLLDYRQKTDITSELSKKLSVPLEKIEEGVRKLTEESVKKDQTLKEMGLKMAGFQAEGIYRKLTLTDEAPVASEVLDGMDKDGFRNLGLALSEYDKIRFCILNRGEDSIQWIIGHGKGVELDFNRIRETLLNPLKVRGGGRAPLWQGGGLTLHEEAAFLSAWKNFFL